MKRDAVSGKWFGTELRLLASALSIRTWRQRGWRVDPGLRYPFRKDGSMSVHDVPEPELFVEDGPPSFPIAAAADRALRGCCGSNSFSSRMSRADETDFVGRWRRISGPKPHELTEILNMRLRVSPTHRVGKANA